MYGQQLPKAGKGPPEMGKKICGALTQVDIQILFSYQLELKEHQKVRHGQIKGHSFRLGVK